MGLYTACVKMCNMRKVHKWYTEWETTTAIIIMMISYFSIKWSTCYDWLQAATVWINILTLPNNHGRSKVSFFCWMLPIAHLFRFLTLTSHRYQSKILREKNRNKHIHFTIWFFCQFNAIINVIQKFATHLNRYRRDR